jgi:transcriptional regulator with XRE-family HTH domain
MAKKRSYNAARPGVRNRIREHRLAAGFSIEELSELVGMSPGAVQRKETGLRNVTVDELETFAAALTVSPADLVPGGVGLSAEERALIAALRDMPERDRRAVHNLAEGLTEFSQRPGIPPEKKR